MSYYFGISPLNKRIYSSFHHMATILKSTIYSYIVTIKIFNIQINCEEPTTFSLNIKMLTTGMCPPRGYRNSNKLMIYFVVMNNYNCQRNIRLSVPVALLLAKICNEIMYSNDFMRVFSLVMMETCEK